MRESLTIFAIAIILVLSALLVGPYFIDWDKHRDWLAARLSHAVGAEVRIAGSVDVRLLPRPIFRAGGVSIAGATPQDPRLSAERLDAELSLNGLLQGTVEFVEARLASPRLEVTMRPDGAIVASALTVENPQKIQFNALSIDDGTIAVMDETGAEAFALRGIAAEGAAETLLGPIKLSGSADARRGKLNFRLNTGAFFDRKLRGRLVVDGTGDWTHAEADGVVALGKASAPTARQAALTFSGNATVLGSLHVADGAAPVPWTLTATGVSADPQALAAPAIELRAGADGRALVANGGALVSLGKAAAALVKLHARQLDLDRIAVPPEVAPDTPRPSAVQWRQAVSDLLARAAAPAIGLSADLGIDAVTAADLTLTDAAFVLDARPRAPPHITASIAGPDGSRIALDGTAELGAAPAFKGRADVATRNIATVAGWADHFWPGVADWATRGGADRAASLKGMVDLTGGGVAARDMALAIGGSTFGGTLSWTAGVGDGRPRLFADLTAAALDADQWPDARHLAALADPLDLSIGVQSDAVRLGRSDTGPPAMARLRLHLTKAGPVVNLDRFELTGLDGATVSASASLDADKRLRAEGRAAAKDVRPLATLARQLLPGQLADRLASRAEALSPLDLGFQAEATIDDDTKLTPLKFSGNGTAGGTRFSGSIAPELRGGNGLPVAVTLTLDAAEAARVLQQWGWNGGGTLGQLHAELQGRGSLADGFETKLTTTLPTATVAFEGHAGVDAGRGRFAARGSDAGALLQTFNLAGAAVERAWTASSNLSWDEAKVTAKAVTARINGSAISGDLDYARTATPDGAAAPSVTGTLTVDTASLGTLTALALGPPRAIGGSGTWSGQPFGPMPAWPSTAVALRVAGLDAWPGIVARDVALTVELKPGSLVLADLSGKLLGGSAGGTLTLRRNAQGASVAGQVNLNGLALALPNLNGRLSGTLDIAGSGSNPAGLVGSLAGDGTVALASATMPRLDTGALGRVAADFSTDDASIEEGPIRDALVKALDRTALALGDLRAPATVAAGVIRLTNLKASTPDAAVSLDASLDLEDLTQNLRATIVASALPKDWKGEPPKVTLIWKGALALPGRDLDAGSFVNGLAARAIAREQERIELMKDDLRERAFFARRLRQIEAEQQAVRDAARIQKMIPEPPRPGDIRLPKSPDPGAPVAPPAQVEGASGPQDELKRLIDALQPKPASRPAKPIDLAPVLRPAAPQSPASAAQDPGAGGRY